MSEDEIRQRAAESVGLTVTQLNALEELVKPLRHARATELNEPIPVFVMAENVWEIEVSGRLKGALGRTRVIAEFRFRIQIRDLELWSGCCVTPDWFKITAGEDVMFEGHIEHPDDDNDTVRWILYDLFRPIRLEAWDAGVAKLATRRVEVNIVQAGG